MTRDERVLSEIMKKYALGSTEALLFNLLQRLDNGAPDHCCIGDKVLMQHLHLSASRVAAIIRRLKDLGLIRCIGKAKKPRKLEVVQDVQMRQG